MTGYTRQSVADIINGLEVTAPPLNAEFNQVAAAFNASTGHSHDGSTGNAPPINLATSILGYLPLGNGGVGGRNNVAASTPLTTNDGTQGYAPGSIWINSATGRVYICVGNTTAAAVWREEVQVQGGNAIIPASGNTVDIGASGTRFKDAFLNTVNTSGNGTIGGILTVNGTAALNGSTSIAALTVAGMSTLSTVTISGGSINGTSIGATTASTVRGTVITATTGFSGTLTGDVTGNLTGNVTGNVTGDLTGNVTGNVTAASGTSSFNNVTINGTLDLNAGTVGTVTGLAAPVNGSDATTKTYVDSADALKLNLTGGTLSGLLNMGSNRITSLGTPTSNADAATKLYVDTSIANLLSSAPAALDTLNELAAALGNDPNFATTVTNSIATKVSKAGDSMTGSLAMGGNKITGLGTPTASGDAATKAYVDGVDATKLNLSGGTMSGAIEMASNKITGVGTPTSGSDAATKSYVDAADALKLNLSGGTMSGAITMGANKVTSTATPTTDDDLTRKGYVDSILGSATAAATSAANAATSEANAASSETNAAASASAAAAAYDSFDDRYLGAKSSPPALDNDGNALITGALYFDTVAELMRVYTGTLWVDAGSSVNGTSERSVYTATSGQTTFAVTYDVGFVDVYLNGVKLVAGTDFTATSGTSIVLATGAALDDTVDIVAYGAFDIANTYTQVQSDARFLRVSNNLSDIASAPTALQNLGLTATAAEINLLDGVVVSTSDLNNVVNKVPRTGTTGSAQIPSGTTAERDASPATGYFRFNSTLGKFEGYSGSAWGSVGGGATGGGSDAVFIENDQIVTTNYTISSGRNAMTTGPISIASGVTVTVPSGSNWVIL